MSRSRIGSGIAVLALLAFAASAPALTLNPGFFTSDLIVKAEDESGPGDEVIRNPLAVPYQTTESATGGAAAANATFGLSETGFVMDFDLTRPGGGTLGFGQSLTRIYFSVDAEVEYRIEGSFTAADPEAGIAEFAIDLQEIEGVSSVDLFSNYQRSVSTPDESFVAGGTGGDDFNALRGSLVGTLLPGREYVFFALARLDAQATPQSGTASGFARLVLVPEPATAVLLASGLLALASRRRMVRAR